MKFLLWITLFLLPTLGHSLAPDHFLYPRDKYALQILGLTPLATLGQVDELAIHFESLHDCEDIPSHLLQACPLADTWLNKSKHLSTQYPFWETNKTQILFFGERHIDRDSQLRFKSLIPLFAQENFTVLALEMFNSSSQKYLDRFVNYEIDLDEILEILRSQWGYNLEGYGAILKSAREEGLKIIGIDDRNSFTDASFSDELILRDQHMAEILGHHLDNKIIVYTGRLHAFLSLGDKTPTVLDFLHENDPNLKAESYLLIGHRERNFWSHLRLIFDYETNINVFKSSKLLPYINGILY